MAVNYDFEIFKESTVVSENLVAGKKMFLSALKDAFFAGYAAGKKSNSESPENDLTTQQGSEPSEICPLCNSVGNNYHGNKFACTNRKCRHEWLGKLLPC